MGTIGTRATFDIRGIGGTLGTFAACVALAGLMACSSRTAGRIQPTEKPGETLAVLLIDEDKSVGRAVVSNPHGRTELPVAYASTRATSTTAPTPVVIMSEAEVQRIFGDALSALPPLTQQFTVYFRFESEELTPDSRTQLPEILQAVKNHAAREVVVVGHTDSTGTSNRNYDLGLSRARTVRDILVSIGLESAIIEVISHGEADQLVRTADEIFEPKNRRVEIMVR